MPERPPDIPEWLWNVQLLAGLEFKELLPHEAEELKGSVWVCPRCGLELIRYMHPQYSDWPLETYIDAAHHLVELHRLWCPERLAAKPASV